MDWYNSKENLDQLKANAEKRKKAPANKIKTRTYTETQEYEDKLQEVLALENKGRGEFIREVLRNYLDSNYKFDD